MIFDSVKNGWRYAGLGERFARAFAYLAETDWENTPAGRYEIDGSDVYVMVQENALKSWSEGRWEAHHNYADIQMVISGSESIGFCVADEADTPVETPYAPESDILFYQEMEGERAVVRTGEMMVLFPEDAHRPCIIAEKGVTKARKAVVKVRL